MELRSSKINKKAPLQTTGINFSTGGFISFLDLVNKYEKRWANPFVSIQPGGAGWPPIWINKMRDLSDG